MIVKLICGCFFLLNCVAGSAQLCFPVKKSHVYFQPVAPGNAAKGQVKTNQRSGNYYIYLVSRKEGITAKDIWINGTHYNARLEKVSSPVSLPSTAVNPAATDKEINRVLVPPTKRYVYQVLLTTDTHPASTSFPDRYAGKPFVAQVKFGKKNRFITNDEIIQLDLVGML